MKTVGEFQVTIKTHLSSGKGEKERDESFVIHGTTNIADKSSRSLVDFGPSHVGQGGIWDMG